MSANQAKPIAHDYRFGEFLAQGLQAFVSQFQAWLIVMCVAAAITVAAFACCILPAGLIAGPLSCGLHHCALLALCGQPVEIGTLKRGWKRAGSSMIAFLAMMAMQFLPGAIMYVVTMGGFYSVMLIGFVGMARPVYPVAPPTVPPSQQIAAGSDAAGTSPEENGETSGAVVSTNIATGVPVGGSNPGARQAAGMVAIFLAMYGFMFLGMLAFLVWVVWFGAKTMYVMPLIADRGCSFFEAFEESWRLTKTRTWELVLLQLFASVLASLGFYVCGVGGIVTLPVYFTMTDAAYLGHALPQFTPPADDVAPAKLEGPDGPTR